jgi:hypothetical protein
MDIMSALKYRGPYEEAYQQSRESEIVNQQRVAQAQQMLQEARMKAEMQPYDIQSKMADVRFKDAQALKMGQEKLVDPKKMADAQNAYQARLHAALQGMQAIPDQGMRDSVRQKLMKEAQEYGANDIVAILETASPEALKAYIDTMGRSKEAAKLQHGAAANQTRVVVQGMGDASRERIAVTKGQFQAQAASNKADKEKTPTSYQAAAVKWAEVAANAETQEQYDKATKMAQEYEAKAKAQASASASTTAGAKAEMVDRVLNPQQGRSGIIGDKSGGSPDAPKPKVYNPQTKRWE